MYLQTLIKINININNGVIKMIQVLTGEKGSGKTKRLISLANDVVSESKGHVVYISNNSEGIFELRSSIRLIDISQFPISCVDSFIGFVYGVFSEDYDIETMFIDNVLSIINDDSEALSKFLSSIRKISQEYGVKFVLGVKGSRERLPELEVEYLAV
jgi:ABC-type proline/glycine betaine transport system ATPase subunit